MSETTEIFFFFLLGFFVEDPLDQFLVGNALRNNPFSPYVPCHRVIASNLSVGGFFGEWGKDDKTGLRYGQKVSILSQEGVHFDRNGRLRASDRVLFKPGVMAVLVD